MSRNLLLIVIICGLIYTNVWSGPAAPTGVEELTVERIFGKPALVSTLPSGIQWLGDGKGISYLEKRGEGDEKQTFFVIQDVPRGDKHVVCVPDTVAVPVDLRKSDDAKFKIGSYDWDKKAERILFTFGGELFTLERKTGRIQRHTHSEGVETNPTFSPDGAKVAFTRDNDLYVLRLDGDDETRLTETGCDSVLNGILDWVYMEELYTRGKKRSFYWSPDGERIAFLQIREGSVPQFPIVDWTETDPPTDLQYYPKPGDPVPAVRVGIVRAEGGDVTWADTDMDDDSYIARIHWLGDSRGVAIETLNRAQDRLTLLFADAKTGRISVALEETDETWVNVNYLKHFYEKKRQFVWGSERTGHQHLFLYNMDGSLIRQLTQGNWEVTELNGVNESKGHVYFTANRSNPLERHLYEVSTKGGDPRQITDEAGTHDVTMSPDNRYYIDRFDNTKRPAVVSVYTVGGKKLFEIADQMTPELAAMERPLPEFIKFKSAEGVDYYCSITKPSHFDRLQKYPVIVYVYGGPHAQMVRRHWSTSGLWHSMMADKGYIVFTLDNRGSYGRGKKWEDFIMERLGRYELTDQLAGVEYLRTLPYVDADRIGIWGWSYGGYMTLLALFKAPFAFKVGAAVAPVTDWRLYDAIYTERYMKLPADNKEGYEDCSPIHFAYNFEGKLLVMHGDADDNVHTQNTYQLIDQLIENGRDFEFMVFPKKKHGIRGEKARVFLFNKMTGFFDRNLLHAGQ
jgi:dipeptidyl-peptidase-4